MSRKAKLVDGLSSKKHPLYKTWTSMKFRCNNPNATNYSRYGARGITVCDQWVTSFKQFVLDMGPRPDGYSIDRVDNNKGYFPENCRWVDKRIQGINQRLRADNKSGFRGVSWCKTGQKWLAYIYNFSTRYHLGMFTCKIEAARAYDLAALQLHETEAKLNFPQDWIGRAE